MSSKIQVKRATQAIFTASNVVLADGEIAYETDTGRLKIGNGITPYENLLYSPNISSSNVSDFASAASAAAPVQSVANKTGPVTLNSADITDFVSSVTGLIPPPPVTSVAGKTGDVSLNVNDISGVYIPFSNWLSSNYKTSIPGSTGSSFNISNGTNALFYGNNIFVLVLRGTVSSVPYILTSNDGITWTYRATTSTASQWFGGIYANNQFLLIVGYLTNSTVAITSPDGITWTQRTLPTNAQWNGLAYGNGIYVITAGISTGSTVAATSPDGITWTQRTLPASASWRSIAYGNGIFVALSQTTNSNVIATSIDGITWTQRTLPASASWRSIAYGNGIFLITTTTNSTIAATSPDGINWTQRTLPSSGNWNSNAYGNGLFMSIDTSTNVLNKAIVSPDGINWTTLTLPTTPASTSTAWTNVAYGNGRFLIAPAGAIDNYDPKGTYGLCSVLTATTNSIDNITNNHRNLAFDAIFNHGLSGSSKTLDGFASSQFCSLSASCTFTMPSATIPRSITLVLTQTGSFTASFTGVKWPAGAAPTITTGANKVDIIRFVSDGISWYGSIVQNY